MAVIRGSWKMRKFTDTPDFARSCFVDVPELDQLVEFVLPRQGLIARFNATASA
jgi:hypothetical protein